ncbi:hypothetical protein [Halomonas caseinilytica]|uniref:Uncharacterized protein n=1 Tax=Halomonas caseinilytica TaxID=438744 RepID=A0A1M6UHT0_9GAMM|nr:hypothetical protein [Halomonas caseinilytica]SHK68638.1 hypothetical protein SAMN05192556_104267 [Halomonas caseinilytica]
MSDSQVGNDSRLIEALKESAAAQRESAAAMRDLAESNRAMIDLLAEQMADEVGGDEEPERYLDGTPVER